MYTIYIYISIVGWGYKPTNVTRDPFLKVANSTIFVEDLMRISPTNISGRFNGARRVRHLLPATLEVILVQGGAPIR